MAALDYILGIDVGGTNSRLQLFSVSSIDVAQQGSMAPGNLVDSKKYMNQDYDKFEDILEDFLKNNNHDKFSIPLVVCLAVAGPIKDNGLKAELTNRNWLIDSKLLSKKYNTHCILINDFVAMGYGLLTLNEDTECQILQNASKVKGAPMACIGAGTGLGECYLTSSSSSSSSSCRTNNNNVNYDIINGYDNSNEVSDCYTYTCYPSEGGHAEFAPRNDLEIELLKYLKNKTNSTTRASVERVVSGPGILSIYEFLNITYPKQSNIKVSKEISIARDLKPAVIAKNTNNCKNCKLTMEIFMTHYGCEAGVAACKWIPKGGLYLTGGITQKNIKLLSNASDTDDGHFMKAFEDKGRLSSVVADIPLFAVLVEDLGERGAHWCAFQEYKLRCKGVPAATVDRDSLLESEKYDRYINGNSNNDDNNNNNNNNNSSNACYSEGLFLSVIVGISVAVVTNFVLNSRR